MWGLRRRGMWSSRDESPDWDSGGEDLCCLIYVRAFKRSFGLGGVLGLRRNDLDLWQHRAIPRLCIHLYYTTLRTMHNSSTRILISHPQCSAASHDLQTIPSACGTDRNVPNHEISPELRPCFGYGTPVPPSRAYRNAACSITLSSGLPTRAGFLDIGQ